MRQVLSTLVANLWRFFFPCQPKSFAFDQSSVSSTAVPWLYLVTFAALWIALKLNNHAKYIFYFVFAAVYSLIKLELRKIGTNNMQYLVRANISPVTSPLGAHVWMLRLYDFFHLVRNCSVTVYMVVNNHLMHHDMPYMVYPVSCGI